MEVVLLPDAPRDQRQLHDVVSRVGSRATEDEGAG
jgi:hypothetical protein